MEWMSIVDFARHYNISDMTVRRRIKTGKLQAVLREGKYYIQSGEGVALETIAQPKSLSLPPSRPTPSGASAYAPTSVSKPVELREPVRIADTEHGNLVEFCNAALRKFSQTEEQLRAGYHSRVVALEEKIKQLEAQLELGRVRESRNKQEIEELHLLLQMLEQPRVTSQPT